MTHAHPTPRLASQTHQGVTARVVRRIGGALRSAFAGLTHARKPRRQAAPSSTPVPQPANTQEDAPKPPRRRRASPPSPTARPATPARPGWIARWFGRKRRPQAASRPQADAAAYDTPFTPQAYPHLTQEACDLLNTPAEDCDPALLCGLVAVFAEHLAHNLPPELGMDAQALFSTLWDRLGAPLGLDAADSPPPDQPDAPAAPCAAVPDTPPAASSPLPDATPPALARRAGWLAAAGPWPMPASGAFPRPGPRRGRHPPRVCRSQPPRTWRRAPPLPRLCYAARASPR